MKRQRSADWKKQTCETCDYCVFGVCRYSPANVGPFRNLEFGLAYRYSDNGGMDFLDACAHWKRNEALFPAKKIRRNLAAQQHFERLKAEVLAGFREECGE